MAAFVVTVVVVALLGQVATAVVEAAQRADSSEATTSSGPDAEPRGELALVVVRSGDTLWAIAERIAPDVDPRMTVDQIKQLNHLASEGDLQSGQRLLVPGTD